MKSEGLEMVRLGMTDLRVSRIAFGTWQLGGEWGSVDQDAAVAAIRHARELGINIFDTAQGYGFGVSEELLGRALSDDLKNRRGEVVIATKGGLRMSESGLVRDASPQWLRAGVDSSLRGLGVDYIDLYQVHWPDPKVPLSETAGALQELVLAGKIRHVGVSNFDSRQMGEFATTRPVETLQPPYHLFRRDIEHETLPYCREHDIGVLVYGPLAHGLLSGALDENTAFAPGDWRAGAPFFSGDSYRANIAVVRKLGRLASSLGVSVSQLAIAWTLAHPAVHVAIVGTRSEMHIEESVAATQLTLGQAELEQIAEAMAGAVPISGPSPEMARE